MRRIETNLFKVLLDFPGYKNLTVKFCFTILGQVAFSQIKHKESLFLSRSGSPWNLIFLFKSFYRFVLFIYFFCSAFLLSLSFSSFLRRTNFDVSMILSFSLLNFMFWKIFVSKFFLFLLRDFLILYVKLLFMKLVLTYYVWRQRILYNWSPVGRKSVWDVSTALRMTMG